MPHIATIQPEIDRHVDRSQFLQRQACRAIIFDADCRIALLFAANDGYYKLPGGGVEYGEDLEAALRRECLEEAGCNIQIIGKLGTVMEFRDRQKLAQTSHCYLADVVDEKLAPHFTRKERREGCELTWVTFKEAIHLMESQSTKVYTALFVKKRELAIIKAAQKRIEQAQKASHVTRKGAVLLRVVNNDN